VEISNQSELSSSRVQQELSSLINQRAKQSKQNQIKQFQSKLNRRISKDKQPRQKKHTKINNQSEETNREVIKWKKSNKKKEAIKQKI